MTLPLHLWLEPLAPGTDLDVGLRAAVADPVWFLTRQWQLGEHQGEDASSPVAVRTEVTHVPVEYDPAHPGLDPTTRPGEALVEAEPGDWWTIGRRVRLGRAFAALPHGLSAAELERLRFGELPEPYAHLAGELDGRKIHAGAHMAASPIWEEVPESPADRWSRRELAYSAGFSAAGVALELRDHDGGDVDWFSVNGPGGADGSPPPAPTPAEPPPPRTVLPGRLTYPGAPKPRWWQIEDHHVDIGGFAPDRSHLGTVLLLDVALAHSDDWFWFPVPTPAGKPPPPSSGVVATIHTAVVRDSFDEAWELEPPPDPELERQPGEPAPWSLFRVAGLSTRSLVIWPVAVAPHAGPLLDDVVLGVDEDANLAWAVELRADGLPLLDDAGNAAAAAQAAVTGTQTFEYLPSTRLPLHWHPYRRVESDDPVRPWVQGLVADLTGPEPEPRPGPASRLIGGPSEPDGFGDGHEVDGRAVPSSGVRLQRRARLARQTDGRPVLWTERRAVPILGPPASQLRFDVFVGDPPPGSARARASARSPRQSAPNGGTRRDAKRS